MVEGVVSQAWARTHHPKWYREVMAKRDEKAETQSGSSL
jgi:formate dehydrogenase subunit gamma